MTARTNSGNLIAIGILPTLYASMEIYAGFMAYPPRAGAAEMPGI